MSILKEIVSHVKQKLPTKNDIKHLFVEKNIRDFKKHIKRNKQNSDASVNLIAEIKKKSPSQGEINSNLDVHYMVHLYNQYAQAISVLTETDYFAGSLSDLQKIEQLTTLPLLRKDFIVSLEQIKESRHYGASAYLLIASILSSSQLEELILAGKEYQMDALVEIHSMDDLKKALSCKYIEILGINNRNLEDLTINKNQFSTIEKEIPTNYKDKILLVSESGISSKKDIVSLPSSADAILVGTNIIKSESPEDYLKNLI